MKKKDLERHLREHGCVSHRQGGNHEIWLNPLLQLETAVPRHREIYPVLARAICKQLRVPIIQKK